MGSRRRLVGSPLGREVNPARFFVHGGMIRIWNGSIATFAKKTGIGSSAFGKNVEGGMVPPPFSNVSNVRFCATGRASLRMELHE